MITKIELTDYTDSLGKQTLYVQADKETMAKIIAIVSELNKTQNEPLDSKQP